MLSLFLIHRHTHTHSYKVGTFFFSPGRREVECKRSDAEKEVGGGRRERKVERKAKRNAVLVLTLTHTLGEDREGIYKRWNFFWFPHW